MEKPVEISDPNPAGPDPESTSRSISDEPINDRAPSDPNHVSEELSEKLKNVGLEEAAKELIVPISDSEGNEESNFRDLSGDDGKEKEKEREEVGGRDGDESEMEKRVGLYPLRPDAEDCSFYMRTGTCKYGSTCKFNHPVKRRLQIGRDRVREREEDVENPKLMECKFYFRTGGCKYGESCRFSHTKQKNSLTSGPELNFLGLPIRPGEKECPFYMRNGSCKFGADCKFNHPDPTTIGGTDSPLLRGNGGSVGSFSPKAASQASSTSWSSSRHMNGTGTGMGTGTAPFIPVMLSQSRGVSPQTPEWNGYQASSMYPPERSVLPPSMMNNLSAETSLFSQLHQQQMPAEEFPERPDQPECSYYLKTGDCKFKYKCKYHHPKNRLPKQAPSALNDKGLPLRPDQSMCSHYSRYGICKFGPACRFDHSIPPPCLPSSSQTMEAPQVGSNGTESDNWN